MPGGRLPDKLAAQAFRFGAARGIALRVAAAGSPAPRCGPVAQLDRASAF